MTDDTSDTKTAAPTKTKAKAARPSPLSGMTLLPGESQAEKEQLREDLLHALAPRTAYERRLAEQLVEYEWDIDRSRRLRDFCILSQYQARARKLLDRGRPIAPFEPYQLSDDDEMLARDLVGGCEAERVKAEQDLLNRTHWHPEHVLAMAAGDCPAADAHEARIRDAERRRALLRREYDELRALRKGPVEDAVIVEVEG